MRPLIVIILGTLILSACSTAGSPSSSPSASTPSSAAPSASPAPTRVPPTTAPPTATPTPTASPSATAVELAAVEIRPIPTRAPASGCTAEDWEAGSIDRAMTLADTSISFVFQTGSPRDDNVGGWSDSVPGPEARYQHNGSEQTAQASAGSVGRLEPASTVTLIDGEIELYALDADDRLVDGVPDATADLGGDDDGLDVPLPTEAGHWLLSVYAHWQSDCASGDGFVDLVFITT